MERAAVLETVLERARERLGAPELGPDDAFHGLGVDSLAVVELALDLEEATGVQLSEDDVARSATLGQLAELLADRA